MFFAVPVYFCFHSETLNQSRSVFNSMLFNLRIESKIFSYVKSFVWCVDLVNVIINTVQTNSSRTHLNAMFCESVWCLQSNFSIVTLLFGRKLLRVQMEFSRSDSTVSKFDCN